MDKSYNRIKYMIESAKSWQDVFGGVLSPDEKYRTFAKIVHPDTGGESGLFIRLNQLWEDYQKTIRSTPKTDFVTIPLDKNTTLILNDQIGIGLNSVIYGAEIIRASGDRVSAFAKVNIADNNGKKRLSDEWSALSKMIGKDCELFFPIPYKRLQAKVFNDSITPDHIFVYTLPNDWNPVKFFSVKEAVEKTGKLHPRSMAWIWRKILIMHPLLIAEGYGHTALTLDHVLIDPEGHWLVLSGNDNLKQGVISNLTNLAEEIVSITKDMSPNLNRYFKGFPNMVKVYQPPTLLDLFDRVITAEWGDRVFFPFPAFNR